MIAPWPLTRDVDRTEKALLDAIRASAEDDDDAPRLVYADWLLERNNPHGELIQLQCAIAAARSRDSEQLIQRERELLIAHHEEWLGTPFDEAISWTFDRGFPNGRFGHTGFFVSKDDGSGDPRSSFACMRFHPDGLVITASISAAQTDATFERIARWFHTHEDRGTYETTFAKDQEVAIAFSATSPHGTVDYEGTISGRHMALASYSHINQNHSERTYDIWRMPSYDSRLPR